MRKLTVIVFVLSILAVFGALVAPIFLTADTETLGGADLPTYFDSYLNGFNGLFLWLSHLGFPGILLSGLWLFFPSWMGKITAGKQTATVLGISAAGGCGLAAVLWCISMSLGGLKDYPVALPIAFFMGFVALAAFLVLCLVYVAVHQKGSRIRGILADVGTSILFLPGFLYFAMWAVTGLQMFL